jgi:hypothetical protein
MDTKILSYYLRPDMDNFILIGLSILDLQKQGALLFQNFIFQVLPPKPRNGL